MPMAVPTSIRFWTSSLLGRALCASPPFGHIGGEEGRTDRWGSASSSLCRSSSPAPWSIFRCSGLGGVGALNLSKHPRHRRRGGARQPRAPSSVACGLSAMARTWSTRCCALGGMVGIIYSVLPSVLHLWSVQRWLRMKPTWPRGCNGDRSMLDTFLAFDPARYRVCAGSGWA